MVGRWLQQLSDLGYQEVRTGAVGPDIARILVDKGFLPVQDLTLLSADMSGRVAPHTPTTQVRPLRGGLLGRRAVVDRILDIDHRSFGDEWSLDLPSFDEATRATHRSRVLVAKGAAGVPVGFVLAGVSDSTGFIQRLAVLPEHRRTGIGLDLMDAAHRWLRSRGSTTSLVNTETDNLGALALYRRCGYAPLPYGLQVLERTLTTGVNRS